MYTVKNVKSFRGREGIGFSCSLYKEDAKIAYVMNAANGAEHHYEFDQGQEKKAFMEYCKSLPPMQTPYGPLAMSPDMVVSRMVDEYEQTRQLRSWCKKYWVVRGKHHEGRRRCVYSTFEKALMDRCSIEQLFGDNLIEIVNDRFEK
jgi:hypothetical protein